MFHLGECDEMRGREIVFPTEALHDQKQASHSFSKEILSSSPTSEQGDCFSTPCDCSYHQKYFCRLLINVFLVYGDSWFS